MTRTRTDEIPHYLEMPSVVTPSECSSHIVREGDDMCPKTVSGSHTKSGFRLDTGARTERLRVGREQLSVHWDWDLGVKRQRTVPFVRLHR